jgi:hypothetical protein
MNSIDMSKPYGQIWGHSQASYEQDGVLYDGSGHALQAAKPEPKPRDQAKVEVANAAESFLKNLLKEGPMNKSNIFVECENAQQNWDAVKNAANSLNVKQYRLGKADMWKLTEG